MKKFAAVAAILAVTTLLAACGGTKSAQAPPTEQHVALPTEPSPTAMVSPTDTTAPVSETSTTASTAVPPTESPTEMPPTATVSPTDTPAPSPAQQAVLNRYPQKGAAAPVKNDVWLNSPPQAWESLRGKVVIVEFWTYG